MDVLITHKMIRNLNKIEPSHTGEIPGRLSAIPIVKEDDREAEEQA